MRLRERAFVFAGLLLFALAFGWVEASAVAYLRHIYLQELSASGATHAVESLTLTLASLPNQWDILFLIPLPWVAPIWAPITVAIIFAAAGSYLFWTSTHERHYHRRDGAVLAASIGLTMAAFLEQSNRTIDRRAPERFAAWIFWTGVGLGLSWFVARERRHLQLHRPSLTERR
jgi:hypothetical protein